jgi:hypothetical protein
MVVSMGDLVKGSQGRADRLAGYITAECVELLPAGVAVTAVRVANPDGVNLVLADRCDGRRCTVFKSAVPTVSLFRTSSSVIVVELQQVEA